MLLEHIQALGRGQGKHPTDQSQINPVFAVVRTHIAWRRLLKLFCRSPIHRSLIHPNLPIRDPAGLQHFGRSVRHLLVVAAEGRLGRVNTNGYDESEVRALLRSGKFRRKPFYSLSSPAVEAVCKRLRLRHAPPKMGRVDGPSARREQRSAPGRRRCPPSIKENVATRQLVVPMPIVTFDRSSWPRDASGEIRASTRIAHQLLMVFPYARPRWTGSSGCR